MIKNVIALVCTFACLGALPALQDATTSKEDKNRSFDLSWSETEHSLSLLNGGEIVWQLNYDRSEDKPYFYPLRTSGGLNSLMLKSLTMGV